MYLLSVHFEWVSSSLLRRHGRPEPRRCRPLSCFSPTSPLAEGERSGKKRCAPGMARHLCLACPHASRHSGHLTTASSPLRSPPTAPPPPSPDSGMGGPDLLHNQPPRKVSCPVSTLLYSLPPPPPMDVVSGDRRPRACTALIWLRLPRIWPYLGLWGPPLVAPGSGACGVGAHTDWSTSASCCCLSSVRRVRPHLAGEALLLPFVFPWLPMGWVVHGRRGVRSKGHVDFGTVSFVVFAWRLPLFFSAVAAVGTMRGGCRLVVMWGARGGVLAAHVGTPRLLLCHHCGWLWQMRGHLFGVLRLPIWCHLLSLAMKTVEDVRLKYHARRVGGALPLHNLSWCLGLARRLAASVLAVDLQRNIEA
jgi:hypothetical protein